MFWVSPNIINMYKGHSEPNMVMGHIFRFTCVRPESLVRPKLYNFISGNTFSIFFQFISHTFSVPKSLDIDNFFLAQNEIL